MNWLDWTVVVSYVIFLIGIGAYLNAFQKDTDDYFLAGQKMKWWQTGFSTMATQLSAISFISVPAFVALEEGGGLRWLAYEFAVPLALILVMIVIIPVLHRGRYISMHQFLGNRFDEDTRSLISGLFLLMRGLASGAIIFAGAKVIAATFGLNTAYAILIMGVITIIYDVLGGIGVVIFSDVIQMAIIMIGLVVCGWVGMDMLGWDWRAVMNAYDSPERFQVLNFQDWGFQEEGRYGFWPFLFGGFFIYVAYYGCDQSQVQREMSVEDEDDVRKSMLLNVFGRFPIVLLYCVVGLVVGAVFLTEGELIASSIDWEMETFRQVYDEKTDWMLPLFIRAQLPHGLTGLLLVAIMAALMSSLDSAINSLSAITVKDFYAEFVRPEASEAHYLLMGKVCTFFWGAFATGSALCFLIWGQAQTVVETINQVGQMFYGPLSAAFLLGILTKWVQPNGVKLGVILGLETNMLVWVYTSWSWLWWGPIGFTVTVLTAIFVTLSKNGPDSAWIELEKGKAKQNWLPAYILSGLYFFVIIGVCYFLEAELFQF